MSSTAFLHPHVTKEVPMENFHVGGVEEGGGKSGIQETPWKTYAEIQGGT